METVVWRIKVKVTKIDQSKTTFQMRQIYFLSLAVLVHVSIPYDDAD